jgi:hypothetical protein
LKSFAERPARAPPNFDDSRVYASAGIWSWTVKITTVLATLALVGCAAAGRDREKASLQGKSAFPKSGEAATLVGAGPIVVAPEVIEGWRFLYRFVTEVEFVLCLEGRRTGDNIHIDGFRLARMEAANASSVRYQPCTSDRYVGTAHNHPPVSTSKSLCYQSLPDRRSFEADSRAVIDIVLCGEEPVRFLWVVRESGAQQQGEAVAVNTARSDE